mmetsp:Transcript_10730/g.24453  ORF Transcript_10730/g.24453 Transcript_10730/m.24453 type:complete len:200 (-) Transcript_10730:21-620(-)
MMDLVASSTTGSNSGSLLPSTAVEEAGKTFDVDDLAVDFGAAGFGAAALFVAEDDCFGAADFPTEDDDGTGGVGFAGTATAILVADVVLAATCCSLLGAFTVAGTFLGMCTGGGCTSVDTASRDDCACGPLPDLRALRAPARPAEEAAAAAWVTVSDDSFTGTAWPWPSTPATGSASASPSTSFVGIFTTGLPIVLPVP